MNKKIKMLVLLVGVFATVPLQAMDNLTNIQKKYQAAKLKKDIPSSVTPSSVTPSSVTPSSVTPSNTSGQEQIATIGNLTNIQKKYQAAKLKKNNTSSLASSDDLGQDKYQDVKHGAFRQTLEDLVIPPYTQDNIPVVSNKIQYTPDIIMPSNRVVDNGQFNWEDLRTGDELMDVIEGYVKEIYDLDNKKGQLSEDERFSREINMELFQNLISEGDLTALRIGYPDNDEFVPAFKNPTDLYNKALQELIKRSKN